MDSHNAAVRRTVSISTTCHPWGIDIYTYGKSSIGSCIAPRMLPGALPGRLVSLPCGTPEDSTVASVLRDYHRGGSGLVGIGVRPDGEGNFS